MPSCFVHTAEELHLCLDLTHNDAVIHRLCNRISSETLLKYQAEKEKAQKESKWRWVQVSKYHDTSVYMTSRTSRRWMMSTFLSIQTFNENGRSLKRRAVAVARSCVAHKQNCSTIYNWLVWWVLLEQNMLLPWERLAVDRDGVLMKALNYR